VSKLRAFGRRNALRFGVYGALVAGPTAFAFWPRGRDVRDGRHDRGENGLWLQHGWLGDDTWFTVNNKQNDRSFFRDPDNVAALHEKLVAHGIRDVFPHLCPALPGGAIMPVHAPTTKAFAAAMRGIRVMPWVGGIFEISVFLDQEDWRRRFVASAKKLLGDHPALAGIHLNVEPCPDGHPGLLRLLDELRAQLPTENLVSIAAYPPPTLMHPHNDVHWSESYYREVASRCHQIVPMLYDTGLFVKQPYRGLVGAWTREVVEWSEGASVLLGLPAYEDRGVGYHDPDVENLAESLAGAHAGLASFASLPEAYRGVALYSEWTMRDADWGTLRERFGRG
jgi:hypothetical protein